MVLQHIEYEARYLAEVAQVDEKALKIYKHSPATAHIEYEARYLAEVAQVDEKALKIYKHSPATAVEFLTQYSAETGDELVKDWSKYFKYLIARFNDGVIKAPGADRPVIKSAGYPQQWLKRIVKETASEPREVVGAVVEVVVGNPLPAPCSSSTGEPSIQLPQTLVLSSASECADASDAAAGPSAQNEDVGCRLRTTQRRAMHGVCLQPRGTRQQN
eukprot:m51a1_g11508 hypothetical protein (217) ;mRNA; f:11446-12337